ncbi:G2/mitotic-specific cyclin S13-7-like isoform X1 [Carex littledalei]|uniref:G2/mitotic-specific cyclin S13-7-like isoform X1 n=1 Tax=Carex littledalei TaxID=544730 RepID=A0A833RAT9_9POAL|nr:G2/mitotic-specific cyclin S13-7-like isoform X1 [Carex littledalei]
MDWNLEIDRQAESRRIIRIPPGFEYMATKNQDPISPQQRRIQGTEQKQQVVLSSENHFQHTNNKVASGTCGVNYMEIDEIDLPDLNNQLAVVEYVKELYAFYKEQQHLCRPTYYMNRQPELNNDIRATAIAWLVKMHYNLRLWPETLYLAVHIIDRYLYLEVTPRSHFQVVVICSLLIASKYEENKALKVNDLLQLTGYRYTKEVVICMEKMILNRLEWFLTVPTTYMFLVRFIKAAKADKELENMIYFYGELGLVEYKMILYVPCKVAAAAVYAARCTLGKSPLWTDTLQRHTSYSESEIQDCAQILVEAHMAAPSSIHKLSVVYTKYKLKEYGGVALYPPAATHSCYLKGTEQKLQVVLPSQNQVHIIEREVKFREIRDSRARAESRVIRIPPGFESMAAKNQVPTSPQQRRIQGTEQKQQVILPSQNKVHQTNNKVASGTCGVNYMEIDEIDLPDLNNQLAVVEYVKELYAFYKEQQHLCRPTYYMNRQPELNKDIRATAIAWLVKMHYGLRLWPETLYLAVHIIDRYLCLAVTPRSNLQLVVICSLLIASKYEENKALKVNDLLQLTGYRYTKEVVICMEKMILNRLEWYLTVPTTYMFLVRFIKAAKADKELENMIYFYGELGLVEYKMILFVPCMVAAAAVYAARCTLGKYPLWTDTLQRHTSYSESEIQKCAQILAEAHLVAPSSVHKLRVVYSKYELKEYGGVALYPPAAVLIEGALFEVQAQGVWRFRQYHIAILAMLKENGYERCNLNRQDIGHPH